MGGYYTPSAGDVIAAANWRTYVRDQTVNQFASAAARDAAITSPAEGMWADLADKDVLSRYDGAAWQIQPFPIVARKTSDQLIASNTTLTNDTALSWAVKANCTYLLELRVQYKADAAGDMKIGWTFPAGLTMKYGWAGIYDSAGAFTSNSQWVQTDVPSVGGVGASVGIMLNISGVVVLSSTAGTLQFQWAQLTSNVNSTAVCNGSYGTLTCVA